MLAFHLLKLFYCFFLVTIFNFLDVDPENRQNTLGTPPEMETVQIPPIKIDPVKIDSIINAVKKCALMPGVMLAIVQTDKNDKIIHQYTKGYGVVNPAIPNSPQTDADTRFCIGSITKQFTAALVGHILYNNSKT